MMLKNIPFILTLALTGTAGAAEAAEPWTLERAIAQALAHNPDARLAMTRIATSRAQLEQATAAFWPKLQLKSSYVWTNNPVTVFGAILNQQAYDPNNPLDFNDVPNSDNFNVQGTLSVPLFAGGANLAGRRAAAAGIEAAQHARRAVQQHLAFEVARAFYSVLKARAFIKATEAAVKAFENNRLIANKRLKTGTLLKADVLDVEVRLARAREDLVRAKNAHALSLRALRSLLGLEHGPLSVADAAPPPAATDAASDFSRRAELAATREGIRAAEAGVRRAKAGYFPHVNAFGTVAFDAGLKHEGTGVSYVAGLMLQWNAWDGFATRGSVSQREAQLAAARENERRLRLALDLELAQARIRLKEATERLAVTDKAITQAEESVQLTRARFEQGLALATQLFDAETALTGARVRRAEAEADQRIAAAALRKAQGAPLAHAPARNGR